MVAPDGVSVRGCGILAAMDGEMVINRLPIIQNLLFIPPTLIGAHTVSRSAPNSETGTLHCGMERIKALPFQL
ncbi:hypothetical protein JRX38_13050 [Gluconobacter cerinus]|uniref:hypothetical protein n=1 Tax=Gluconobacter cerinus TaxID=38307 RepID=UPI00193F7CE1|nr:hypothetical protein [Gluconobacter cerinus]MBM3098926.1 hypothetical protein [Gluconobacter cerinus]